jgi:hypothetical protein
MASIIATAVTFATALRCIQWLINSNDDVSHSDLISSSCQGVTAAWATSTFDDIKASQFTKQLFKI